MRVHARMHAHTYIMRALSISYLPRGTVQDAPQLQCHPATRPLSASSERHQGHPSDLVVAPTAPEASESRLSALKTHWMTFT